MDIRVSNGVEEKPDLSGWKQLPNNPDFWRLWLVGLVIFVVRWTEMLAVAVFVYQRTGSAFIVAMLTMLRMLPMGLFGAFIGATADRLERRTALLVVVLSMLMSSGILALLAYTDRLEVWHLAVASFVNGVGWTTDNPVRRMMIGEVVGADRMSMAMSIDIGANNTSRVLGPMLGGVLLAWIGIHGAFELSVALYIIALVAAIGVRYRNSFVIPSSDLLLARVAESLRAVRHSPALRSTLLVTVIYNIFGWPFTSMIPVIARDQLHLTADAIGLLASMDGVGAFCCAVAVAVYAKPANFPRIYIGSVAANFVMIMLFAWSPTPLLAGAALFIMGFTQSGFSIMQATLVFCLAPPDMRARVLGVLAVCIGLGPIGFIHIGLLADAIGAPATAVVTGIEGLCALLLTRRFWRHLWEQT